MVGQSLVHRNLFVLTVYTKMREYEKMKNLWIRTSRRDCVTCGMFIIFGHLFLFCHALRAEIAIFRRMQ